MEVYGLKKAITIGGSLFIMLATAVVAFSESLPIKTYTTADGLAFDRVNRIVRDSRGFLWFCTDEGLSRFDGYGFTSYTKQDGLPHPHVNDMVETRRGVYWVATDGGLCRFDPTAGHRTPSDRRTAPGGAENFQKLFLVYEPGSEEDAHHVNAVIEDSLGTVWCGTDAGLYRMTGSGAAVRFDFVEIGAPHEHLDARQVHAIAEDHRGSLWVGSTSGLYRRTADGTQRYSTRDGLPGDFVQALLVDRDGRLWAGTRFHGLCLIATDANPKGPVVARSYTQEDGLASNRITCVLQSSDGKLWVGTIGGLCEFAGNASTEGKRSLSFITYSQRNGLSTADLTALAEDMGHNLWLGTLHGGAMRLARSGFTSFSAADGLGSGGISSIFEDRSRQLCVTTAGITSAGGVGVINRFDGKRFVSIAPNLRAPFGFIGSWNDLTMQDREGEWWVPTQSGLFRFPKVSVDKLQVVQPTGVYTAREGLPENWVIGVYEDSRGDLWLSIASTTTPVARWERTTGRIQPYHRTDGLPAPGMSHAMSFVEDRTGGLWMGFSNSGGLVCCRGERFRLFTGAAGLPDGQIADLYVDRSGRLWIAAGEGGLLRLDEPAADQPHFVRYTESQGLSSSIVWCITEDERGRIFVGTGRGVDLLAPDTGRVTHYTSADGLAGSEVRRAFRDHEGVLWFSTASGLSRLAPQVDEAPSPPPVFIVGVRAGGRALGVSDFGESRVEGLALGPAENRVQIDFVGLGFAAGESLRYKYRLEGADPEWSIPGEVRTVSYPSLRPGKYRFEVLAVSTNGALSESPASIAFEILPPIWQRWWFLTPAAMLIALLTYRLYRYRVARLVELERVRTRIATDLHDDIGSSLSRMAILSEVVKQRMGSAAGDSQELLTEIAESGRRLVDTMSDIVWSIDPRRDDLSNLASRVREFAAGLLDTRPIKWSFQIPPEMDHLKLGPDERRQVFLIMKEAITNVARHARCGTVSMSMSVSQNKLLAEVSDDGCGFSPVSPENRGGGQGLESMKSRAAHLGGDLSVTSAPGRGTRLRVEVPIRGRRGR